jgi:putative ABC transport system permease protein
MKIFRLAIRLMQRDLRGGEWWVLLIALVLAVGSLATVGLFSDRVHESLQQRAQALIGADLRITSTRPFSSDYREWATRQGLQVVETLNFPSMVGHGDQALLSEIQSVETGYPLRGNIEIDDGTEHIATGIPVAGSVWVEQRLLRQLGLKLNDQMTIGERRFDVAAMIIRDVDQSLGFSSFAPRVLMNETDLASTGLVQVGSRISYRLMFSGDAGAVQSLRTRLEARLSESEKIEGVRDARPEIRKALERAEHFLGLAALTAAILAGAAIALASRRFVERHLDGCAVMRCLGAQQADVLLLFLYQFVLLGVVAAIAGVLLGYVTQALLVSGIPAMRDASLPQPGIVPALKAGISGLALLLGFAFLPLLQLRNASPLRVLRREVGQPKSRGWIIYVMATLVLAPLFVWHGGSLKLGLLVLVGLLAGFVLFGGIAWLMLRALKHIGRMLSGQWRHAVNNLARRARNSVVQVVALSLGGMALLLLTVVRTDLVASWQGSLPANAPNRFLVNVQSDQIEPVSRFFDREKLESPELLPMVRGRLVEINHRPVSTENYTEQRAQNLVAREFNLSYMPQMPGWNQLVGGRWWRPGETGQLSVEEGIARTLGIALGDELTYDVAGSRFTARVTNLRKVQWDSMKVNFFVIATPDLLRDFPASYLGSFYLPRDKVRAGDALFGEFPNVLVIDAGAIISQIRGIMDQIAQAASAVFLFTVLTGFVVLYAALLAAHDERRHEAAILRTLGASGGYMRRLHLAEFAVLGGLSGFLAAGGAVVLGWALAEFILEIPYHFGAGVWITGLLCGIATVALAGWLGTRRLSIQPPLAVLRT